ncbi:MAG: SMI1/KNR4 family protein [Alphaproteobacteria bacterium]|nr:SMI1/KNR4 family protein [Alphaproteobacteria bacterium]
MFRAKDCFKTFDPVSKEQLKLIQGALKNNRLIPLPEDYCDFLNESNGGICGDIEFYGTAEHFFKKRFFTFPDIVNYNKRYLDDSFLFNRVIIGQDSQVFFIYDGQKKTYLICDRISFIPIKAFRIFEDLKKYLMID